jgi:hypothetical protein
MLSPELVEALAETDDDTLERVFCALDELAELPPALRSHVAAAVLDMPAGDAAHVQIAALLRLVERRQR